MVDKVRTSSELSVIASLLAVYTALLVAGGFEMGNVFERIAAAGAMRVRFAAPSCSYVHIITWRLYWSAAARRSSGSRMQKEAQR